MKKTILLSMLCLAVATAWGQKEKGFGMGVEAGYGIKLSKGDFSALQLQLSPGYHLNKLFFVGLGAGVSSHTNNINYGWQSDGPTLRIKGYNFISVPIYAHATFTAPTGGKWLPFVNLKAGYGVVSDSYSMGFGNETTTFQRKGGFYVSPAVGVKYRLENQHTLSLSVAYDRQNYTVNGIPLDEFAGSAGPLCTTTSTEAIAIRLGWSF